MATNTTKFKTLHSVSTLPYYELAFSDTYKDMWKGIVTIANDNEAINDLAFYRALTCWFETDKYAIQDRRTLLFQYARAEFKTDNADDTLNRYAQRLPIRSRVRRVLRNVCSLYTEEPHRTFSENESLNEEMLELYGNNKINSELHSMHQLAKLTGIVAVRPYFHNERLKLQTLSLDACRIRVDNGDFVAVTYPRIAEVKGKRELQYVTWSDEERIVQNVKGDVVESEENTYARLPFVFLRFGNGKYGEPLFDMIESQLDANKTRLLARINLTYTGLAVWLGINLGKEDIVVSPDHLLAFDGVKEGEGLPMPPTLESISPDAQFEEIDNFADSIERSLQHEQGIPPSMTSESQETPPSGIARIIERQELIEFRYNDQMIMRDFEQDLAEMIAHVASIDGHLKSTINEDSIDVAVTYAEEKTYVEPTDEFEFDMKRSTEGLMPLRNYFEKWGVNLDSEMSDDDFIAKLQAQEEMNARIKSVRSGAKVADQSADQAQTDMMDSAQDAKSATETDADGLEDAQTNEDMSSDSNAPDGDL